MYAHQRDMIGYPAARLALTAQSYLSDFLRRMIDLILEGDLSAAAKGRKEWDILAEENFQLRTLERPISVYVESAFGPPPRFDAGHLVNLFESRVRAAEDELRLLQTDPTHFRDLVNRAMNTVHLRADQGRHSKYFVMQIVLQNLAKLPMLRWILTKCQRLEELTRQASIRGLSQPDYSLKDW